MNTITKFIDMKEILFIIILILGY